MKKIILIAIMLSSLLVMSQNTQVLNNKLILKSTPNLSIIDSLVTKDANQMLRSTSVNDFKSQLGISNFLSNIVEDLTPQLGGNLDLNSRDITGAGNINTSGNLEILNTVKFTGYPSTRTDIDPVNILHTDISGNLLSSSANYFATKTELDNKLNLTGGTLTGDLYLQKYNNISMDNQIGALEMINTGSLRSNYTMTAKDNTASGTNIRLQVDNPTAHIGFNRGGTTNSALAFLYDQLNNGGGIDFRGEDFLETPASGQYSRISQIGDNLEVFNNLNGDVLFRDASIAVGRSVTESPDSGSISFLEDVSKKWGVDAAGFRFMLNGSTNTFHMLSGTTTNILEIFQVERNSGDFSFNVKTSAPKTITNELQLTPTTQPLSPIKGDIYYDNSENQPKHYDGTLWRGLSGLPAGYYEEGTFTPTLTDSGGGATYTFTAPGVANANYVRTGNRITGNLTLTNINTTGTPTGVVKINGLPNQANMVGFSAFNVANLNGGDVAYYSVYGLCGSTGLEFRIQATKDTDINQPLSANTFTGGEFIISFEYTVDVYTP